jgi:hypothetical protein
VVRRRRVIGLVLFVLVGLPALLVLAVILRGTVFAPTFDVPSIAATHEYKDDALLDRAWSQPVAASYGRRVVSQSNGSVCGPATLANAMRSLGDANATQDTVLAGTGKCGTGICFMGLTLDELAAIARTKTGKTVTVLRDLTLDEFRTHLRRANDPSRRYLVNFHRGMLFGKGTGHHSPIAAYLEPEDLVLVLDVNDKFGPWLVSTQRLYAAMDTIDGSSGKKRGLIVLE